MAAKAFPYNLEAEKNLLGHCIRDFALLGKTIEALTGPEDFYATSHQYIFNNLVALFKENQKVSLLVLINKLTSAQILDICGGYEFISSLVSDSVISEEEFEPSLEIVKDKAIKRRIIGVCSTIQHRAFQDTESASVIADSTMSQLWEVSGPSSSKIKIIGPGDMYKARMETLAAARGFNPLYTNLPELNELIATGRRPGEISVVAGRPGQGKSAFKTNDILYQLENKKTVVSIALEQTFDVEQARIESQLTKIPLTEILNAHQWKSKDSRVKMLKEANHRIDEEFKYYIIPSRSIESSNLRALFYSISKDNPIDLVYFDLFDRLADVNVSEGKASKVAEKLGLISQLTEEFKFHASLLVQINREVEKRALNKRPRIAELKDSGAYEEVARLIMLLYREKYYQPDSLNDTVEIIIGKQNNGPTGTVTAHFRDDILAIEPELNHFGGVSL